MEKTERKGFLIYSRINIIAANRLRRVRADWGFKSSYEIIRYIIYCFIRVADIEHTEPDEDLPPEELKRIFGDLHADNREFEFVKPKRLKKHEKSKFTFYTVRIKSNVTARQLERLERIRQKYNFASVYEILQYSIACFIRALDTANEMVEPEPVDIDNMFSDFSESEIHFEYSKPKRAPSDKKQKQALYS